jgi:hypothetical protein
MSLATAAKPPLPSPIVPLPADARDEIVVHDVLRAEERLWVAQSEGVAFLHVGGGYTHFDAQGRITGREDVFTKIDPARAHDAAQGLPMSQLERPIR